MGPLPPISNITVCAGVELLHYIFRSKIKSKHPTSTPLRRCVISSTPKPKGHSLLLADIFDDSVLSPIVGSSIKTIPNAGQSNGRRISNVEKPPIPGPRHVQRKRKQPTKVPKKESASAEVLKELKNVKAPNALSYSFNRYNLNPEPIILSSDEEEGIKDISTRKIKVAKPSSTTPKAKKNSVKKSAHEEQKIKLVKEIKNQDTILLDSTQLIADEEVLSDKQKPTIFSGQMQLDNMCMAVNTCSNTGNNSTDEEDDLFSSFKKKNVKKPNDCLVSEKEIEIAKDTKHEILKKASNKEDEKEGGITEEGDDLFSSIKKRNKKQSNPSVAKSKNENENNDQQILFRKPSCEENNLVEDKSSTKVTNRNIHLHRRKKNNGEEREHPLQSKTVRTTPELARSKNTLSQDKVCYFTDTVFRRNTRSGGVVASSLETGSQKCGFIELEKDERFKCTTSDIIFLILEGCFAVDMSAKSGNLSIGDVLHVGEFDGGCTFKCLSEKARMYYTKNKH